MINIIKKEGRDFQVKIFMIGDIVGENGVHKVKETLTKIKEEMKIDFVIVNGENSAGGMGMTTKIFQELKNMEINCITMGNHTWGKKDIFSFIDEPVIIRPANYSKGVVGKGYHIYTCLNKKICVINLIGRTDMGILSDNPFTKIDEIWQEVKDKVDVIFLDFHAEATAEKIAMKYYVDGRISAMVGTHTHVQTADEEITKEGMAYITDVGMTGPKDSVIGMNKEASIKRFLTSLPERYQLASGECMLNGCVITIEDEKKGAICRATSIERIYIR